VNHPIVVGTAGHIDHGKTSLVRALTGIDTDRLPIEKARGITTELGFARLQLGDRTVAVVDVPGHERFVKSMVAGAVGLDLVVLVVAADEGVMPQTREHLEICDLLGVRRGIVALTKRDLVDDEWLAMIAADVQTALAKTTIEGSPIIAVSTKTDGGVEALRAELRRAIDAVPPREQGGVFRLPIDRVFTVKGFGTVVTGTILGGEVAVGDELALIGSTKTARVRGIEVHGEQSPRANAGLRAALNLGGLGVDDVVRGDMLVHPTRVAASHIIDVELRVSRLASKPMRSRSKLLLHHATAQTLASVVLVDREDVAPGGTALAQLRIDRNMPLGALPGDHFILRGFVASASSGSTVGGGRIVRVQAPKARKGSDHARIVSQLANARLDGRIALLVEQARAAGMTEQALVSRLGVPPRSLAPALAMLARAGDLMVADDHYLHATTVAGVEREIATLLEPSEGFSREELRTRLPATLPSRAYDIILAGLERRGVLRCEGERVMRASQPRAVGLSHAEVAVLTALDAAGIEAPRPKDLPVQLGLAEPQIKAALEALVGRKLAVKIKPDLVLHARVVDDVRARLLAHLTAHGTIDAQQWKTLTGASRKFTIPLAEYFDGEKLTLRVGDVRRLRAAPQKK
jgi:selenocysteine-specific elongation factor